MRERPILFSAPMVRAILEGRKTQTRRVFQPERMTWTADGRYQTHAMRFGRMIETGSGPFHPNDWLHYCPYGQPGDRLWVRETWGLDDTRGWTEDVPVYRADESSEHRTRRWRPSIHMPRWASRIDLEVTGVRVERLQDIGDDDCWAEAPPGLSYPIRSPSDFAVTEGGRQRCYQRLWESINGPGSWEANPWVWCVEFRRLSQAGGP